MKKSVTMLHDWNMGLAQIFSIHTFDRIGRL